MFRRFWLAVALVALFGGSFAARQRLTCAPTVLVDSPSPQRIVSIAPSVTETLFALGMGERVAGVSRYCNYPPAVKSKPRIGGFLDPNFEAIVALRPDLAILLEGDSREAEDFGRLGIPTLVVCHKNVAGILESIDLIGRRCGVVEAASWLRSAFQARLDRVRQKTANVRRPRVLFVVERTWGTGAIEDVYAAGSDGHIDQLLALAGARNAVGGTIRFPVLSAEGVVRIDPEVIVDLAPHLGERGLTTSRLAADWQSLGSVAAVRQHRIYVLDDDFLYVPGPRLVDAVERLARLIHPDLSWEEAAP